MLPLLFATVMLAWTADGVRCRRSIVGIVNGDNTVETVFVHRADISEMAVACPADGGGRRRREIPHSAAVYFVSRDGEIVVGSFPRENVVVGIRIDGQASHNPRRHGVWARPHDNIIDDPMICLCHSGINRKVPHDVACVDGIRSSYNSRKRHDIRRRRLPE